MPTTVISVMRLAELNRIDGDGKSGLKIGASVLLSDICEHPIIKRGLSGHCQRGAHDLDPALTEHGTIAATFCWTRAAITTIRIMNGARPISFCLKKDGDVCWVAPGSSKCWAVQSSDLVPVMVAIGARFRLVSTLGERMIDAAGFYNDDGIDYLKKRPDELLVDVHLPPTDGWRAAYQKLRRRGAFDFPVLGVRPGSEPGA